MKLSKIFVIVVNIFLLVLSIVLIGSASTPKYILGDFYYILTTGNSIDDLNIIWIASGFVLLGIGVFGLWSALKDSLFMMNLYTVILSFTLILQIVTGATSNQLGGELDYMVSYSIKDLMVQYGDNSELTLVMDSIQKQYSCCGYNGPADWQSLNDITTSISLTESVSESTSTDVVEETASTTTVDVNMIMEQETIAEILFKKYNTLPTSCCNRETCKNYYSRGCFNPLYNDIARIVHTVKSTAMISSVFQVFGILAAYIFGRTLQGESSGHRIRRI